MPIRAAVRTLAIVTGSTLFAQRLSRHWFSIVTRTSCRNTIIVIMTGDEEAVGNPRDIALALEGGSAS